MTRIRDKLVIRINQTKSQKAQDLTTAPTPLPSQYPSAILRFEFDSTFTTHENFNHPFSVQVGSSRSENLCYLVASMLRKLDYPAFNSSLKLSNRGIWHRVYIGSFATRDAAQKVKDQLLTENITEGFIRHLPYAVQIGGSGNAQQLQPLQKKLLMTSHLPYSTPIRNASSSLVEGRLLIGACYAKNDCDLLLKGIADEGYRAVVVER